MSKPTTICMVLVALLSTGWTSAATAEESGTISPAGFRPARHVEAGLPKVLLVGDSICSGYSPHVIQQLANKAVVDAWVTGINLRLGDIEELQRQVVEHGPYDVIHFNIGLHGLGDRIPADQYEPLLRKYVAAWKKLAPRSRLIWASITPTWKGKVKELSPDCREGGKILVRNAIAARVMKENGITVDDLFSLAAGNLGLGDDGGIHWKVAGYELMAKQIVQHICEALDATAAGRETEALRAKPVVDKDGYLYPTLRDVRYGPHERNILNFWKAHSDKPTPVIVMIHGGGWHGGNLSSKLAPADRHDLWAGQQYLEAGISMVSITYRLTPKNPLPAPVHDAARAVQFVRYKAKAWGLDKTKLAVAGGSAGATTSLWLIYHDDLARPDSDDPVEWESTKPTCAVAEAPQTCIDPKVVTAWVGEKILDHYMIRESVGLKSVDELLSDYEKYEATLREFSPYFHVDGSDPPALLYCFSTTVTPAASPGIAIHDTILSWKLKLKADEVGAECDMIIRSSRRKTYYNKAVEDFIKSKLLGR